MRGQKMILCDRDLLSLGPQLLDPFDETLVSPASVDIRIGNHVIVESKEFIKLAIDDYSIDLPMLIEPGDFILVETLETLKVPNGYAVEMKLKSSRAREGWNHSLAFWFDPGWHGVATMELHNVSRFQILRLYPGLRIGQIIVHRLSGDAINPYKGKYQGATSVEMSKE